MADKQQDTKWNHTASLIAAIFEQNRDRKKRRKPFSCDDFKPKRKQPKKLALPEVEVSVLKSIFCK
jgi:hypothetical protein